jgi:hypothetical protein
MVPVRAWQLVRPLLVVRCGLSRALPRLLLLLQLLHVFHQGWLLQLPMLRLRILRRCVTIGQPLQRTSEAAMLLLLLLLLPLLHMMPARLLLLLLQVQGCCEPWGVLQLQRLRALAAVLQHSAVCEAACRQWLLLMAVWLSNRRRCLCASLVEGMATRHGNRHDGQVDAD